MIDLAPNSKRGLELSGPLILAGGFGGEFERPLVARAAALVTLPISLRPRAPGRDKPTILEFPGGFLLRRDGGNPGLAEILRTRRHIWQRLGLVIILALASEDLTHWGEIARRVSRIERISALELEIVEGCNVVDAVALVRAETDLPIIARIPVEGALERAEAALEGGADALTVGLAPRGIARLAGRAEGGRLAGPVVKPLTLRAVYGIAEGLPGVPLIAAGGVQVAQDVQDFLEAGARAVQIDTALWREPEVFLEIADGMKAQGVG